MYLPHFGLREFPFGMTPDSSCFFPSGSHQSALNTLLVATQSGEGFLMVTGEVGSGKTTLCRRFLSALPGQFLTAYIPNPYLDARGIYHALAEEFGLDSGGDAAALLHRLNRAMLAFAAQGLFPLVCVDEAQALPTESLEAIRLLTNLETEKRKLLQVVLFGQPELETRLDTMPQLKTRIAFQSGLRRLSRRETADYVRHRMLMAGAAQPHLFSRAALAALHTASRGLPRLINLLAHKALLIAFGRGAARVGAQAVAHAIADTPAARQRGFRLWWVQAGAALSDLGMGMMS
jgi:MSHA biogenesis protein MshM